MTSRKPKIVIVFVFLTFVFAGAFSALGHSGFTQTCGDCHTNGGLTLTSNTTTVDVTISQSFGITVTSTGYSRGDEKVAISLRGGWADNDEFSFTPAEVMDNSGNDLNGATDTVEASFSFTPLSVGTWTLRIWTAGKNKASGSVDITVTVTAPSDTTPPTIDSPIDMTVSEGDSSKNITWSPSDANPSSYEVFDDSVSWLSGGWDGSSITVQLSSFGLGTHNITLSVWDVAGNDAWDQVDVTVVDGTVPLVDSPANITYNEEAPGNSITWDPTDSHPSSYTIYRGGTPVKSGAWNSSIETVSISVDGLSVGTYNYTILVTDVGSNTANDTVWVIVDDGTLPTIDSPADVPYYEDTAGHSITWDPSDLNPVSYVIYKDGVPVKSGSWNSSSETITISVDGLSVGSYSYVLNVTDVGSNVASDTVAVIVSDGTLPLIDSPANITYDEGTTGHSITWNPSDLNPMNYTIYRDGVPVKTGSWNASVETISISVDGLSLGIYNYQIVVGDIGLNTESDIVVVTVNDGTDPTIDSPIVADIVEGTTGNLITWDPYDLHPSTYQIYREDVLVKSGLWNSSAETISLSMDGLSLGTYNITIIVYDTTSRTALNTLFVTVYDGTYPVVDNPANIDYPDGDTGYSITWSPTDDHPVSYQILREGVPVKSGAWNSSGETMTISVDGLAIGVYNYTIVLVDIGGLITTDEVSVTVFSADLPSIDHPVNQTISEDSVGLQIVWNPLDLNPSTYAVYQEGILVKSGLWNSSVETISISLDGLSLGTYNYTIIVTDQDTNTATDTVWITVIDGTPPVVDSPSDITYDEDETGSAITWNPSDLHPVSYTIYLEGSPIKSGLWNSSSEPISISVDGQLVGEYNFTIVVLDIGGLIGSDTVFVYVLDGTPPTIDSPSNIDYNEGEAGGSITWNPSDSYPDSYQIYRNEILVKSGAWNSSSEPIIISVTGLVIGIYNFTTIVYDVGGNNVSDIVWVTVSDATLPTIDTPIDRPINEGQIGDFVIWTPDDLNPVGYEIYRDDILIRSGAWNASSETISISLNGLSLGIHNFTLLVSDIGTNTANDTVFITVVDGAVPTIDSPSDVLYDEGNTGYSITWDPSDLHPVSYEILQEGVQVKTGAWNSTSETITINVDGLSLGTYNFTIYVSDVGGNTANDTVFVNVNDGTVPTIDSPPNVTYDEGDAGNSIVWNPSDTHPSSYEIYREDSLIASGLWNSSSETISVSVDGHQVGTYNYTIRVLDVEGSSASDTVFVFVQDGTLPVIDSPTDVNYIEGETGNSITWNPSDLYPISYEIFRDGMLVKSGSWNSSSETITITVDGLTPGAYNFSILVTDTGNNYVTDQVDVTVQASTSSTTITTTTTTSTTTSQPTENTPTGTSPSQPIPVMSILTVVLTWIGAGILLFYVADVLVRRSRS